MKIGKTFEELQRPKGEFHLRALAVNMILAGSIGVAAPAYAIDVDAGDWATAPAGTNMGLVYVQHASRSQVYSQGNVAVNNAQLQSDVEIFRYVHWTTFAGHPAALEVLLPFAQLQGDGNLSALGSASGSGDVILVAPVWLVDNKTDRESFAIAPYVFLPTGAYDKNRALNIGENRTKYDLQFGYMHGIGNAFDIDLAGDVMYFGKNTDTSLTQKPLYQVQGYLSYQWTPATKLAVGLSHSFGGETAINGVDQNDQTKTTKTMFTVSTFIDQRNQLLFSYGKDLSVANGLKEDSRFNVRLLHVF